MVDAGVYRRKPLISRQDRKIARELVREGRATTPPNPTVEKILIDLLDVLDRNGEFSLAARLRYLAEIHLPD